MFDGDDLTTEVDITFEQSIQEGGLEKEITVNRSVICSSCNGSRESVGSKSNTCYSCKGTGVKEDSLFKKQVKCNTCSGHGKLIQSPCHSCKGTGLVKRLETVKIKLDRFTRDQETLKFDLLGDCTLYPEKGKNGCLCVKVSVIQEAERWRNGQDIYSRHYVTLSQALQGCKIKVPTVHGVHSIDLSRFD